MPGICAFPSCSFYGSSSASGSSQPYVLSAQDYLDRCEGMPGGMKRLKASFLPRVNEDFTQSRLLECFGSYLTYQETEKRGNLDKKREVYETLQRELSNAELLQTLRNGVERLSGFGTTVGETVLNAWRDCLRRTQLKASREELKETAPSPGVR